MLQSPYTALLLVPTGIGAAVGGFAGDALPVARSLAAAVDRLIAHPNVLNGASLFWPIANALYVEGLGIDRACAGEWNLRPVRQNRVGMVFDAAIEPDLLQRHHHAIQAARATLGLNIVVGVTTAEPLGVQITEAPSGASCGTLARPRALLDGAQRALQMGAEAIAIVARFPDDLDFTDYSRGIGVDPLAGVEAILSHLVVREFGCPCAHAPALRLEDPPTAVHPRAAAEEIGFTFLPSVLAGLSYAPQFVPSAELPQLGDISAGAIDVAIAPATAFGSPALLHLAARERPPLFVAVSENTSVMEVLPQDLGIAAIEVDSYLEAIGLVTAHRAGVALKSVLPEI
ncbi:DUF3326 domain-containing protein [Synechococcus sp. PCC 7336]|uniref:DUF3326 domain-containing protein n=1 Tax=Synechococcus sp. PCC 7336 TaxID=195250 RepID=UPI00034AD3A1